MNKDLVLELINALTILPGVGKKSAQRMALYLLDKNKDGARILANTLADAVDNIQRCTSCRMLTSNEVCNLCEDNSRDDLSICVVENPSDVLAIESTGGYKGKYFVLMGRLSPIDGITPEDLGIPMLIDRIRESEVKEIIIATSPTVEGDATSFYIRDQIKDASIIVSRIAYGVPMGGELEYVDNTTLSRAIQGRRKLD